MKHIILIIAICFTLNLRSQTIIEIFDKTNFKPIENVNIFLNGQLIGSSNLKGLFKLQTKPNDAIKFEHISYESISKTLNSIDSNNIKVFLKPKLNLLQEITIASKRFESNKNNIAQTVTIIDNSEINKLQPQTTADILQNSGLAFVQKSQLGGGSPIIRGFEANKVLLVVDGIRMNNAIYRGGHLQNIITVDPNSLNKIEILEGPGSVLYGSDALGGTIYMETIKPVLNDSSNFVSKGNFVAKTSSANIEKSSHFDINIANDKFASLTSISYSNFGDLRQGSQRNPFYGNWGKRLFYVERVNNRDSMVINKDPNIQVGSGYSQYDILQKVLYKGSKALQILGNIQFSNSSNVSRYDRLTQLIGTLPKFAEWYYGPQKRLLTYVQVNYTQNNLLFDKMQFTPAYQNIEESRHDRKFNNNNLNHRIEKLNILSLNADFEKNIKNSSIIYGIDVSHEKVNSTANTENIIDHSTQALDTRYPDGGSTMSRISVFANHQIKISDKLSLNEGIRFNASSLHSTFNDTSFYNFPFKKIQQKNNAITSNIGIVYKIINPLKLHLNYSSGYRTPNVDDLSKIFESVPGTVIMPNENLKPEYTHNFDFGYHLSFENQFSWYTNAFYTIYTNAITTEPGKFNGQDSVIYNGQMSKVMMNVNKAEAYLYGISSNMVVNLNSSLDFVSNVTYTYGRIKTDSTDYPLDHIPPIYGKIGFQYKNNRLNSEINMMYNGWKFLSDYNLYGEDNFSFATAEGMPSWITFNIYTLYQVHKNFQLTAALENILDQNYRVFSSNISAPGRNFKLGIKYTW